MRSNANLWGVLHSGFMGVRVHGLRAHPVNRVIPLPRSFIRAYASNRSRFRSRDRILYIRHLSLARADKNRNCHRVVFSRENRGE